jgi:hypothetical protein
MLVLDDGIEAEAINSTQIVLLTLEQEILLEL